MKALTRTLWFVAHAAWSLASLVVLAVTRRRAVLVFTHEPDVVRERDRQMGPLVERLSATRVPFVEIVFVALDCDFVRCVRRLRRPFISYALLAGPARVLSLASADRAVARNAARARLAGWLLDLLRPTRLILTDESGSGQPLVRAARARALPVLGIQHGDFQPDNAQYAPVGAEPFAVEPVDLLCVWSEWFAARLRRVSPIYDARRIAVTGRLRFPASAQDEPNEQDDGERNGALRVLLLSEAGDAFPEQVAPYLAALDAAADVRLTVRPHPAEARARWAERTLDAGELGAALARCDLALGVASSALLEALYHRRPAVTLVVEGRDDPAGYAADSVVARCALPEDLVATCRALAADSARARLDGRRARVWGADEGDAVEAVLERC